MTAQSIVDQMLHYHADRLTAPSRELLKLPAFETRPLVILGLWLDACGRDAVEEQMEDAGVSHMDLWRALEPHLNLTNQTH